MCSIPWTQANRIPIRVKGLLRWARELIGLPPGCRSGRANTSKRARPPALPERPAEPRSAAGVVGTSEHAHSGAERHARMTAVATLPTAQNGTSGVLADGKHARPWATVPPPRPGRGHPAGRYLPVRSRCLHPGQQQGRRWPSSSSSWVRRMRRSRVISCLASSTQQMNSLRARGVMSFQAPSAAGLATSALRRSSGSSWTTPPGTRRLLTRPR